jgi:hypothetical protein
VHLTQHFLASWLAGAGLARRRERIVVALAGIAPDVDAPILLAPLLVGGGREWFVEFHHDFTHHVAGAALAAAAGWWASRGGDGGPAPTARRRAGVAALAATTWCGHLVLDMLGAGDRNADGSFAYTLPLLWPFSGREFAPFPFAWPLASWQNGVVMAALLAVSVPVAVRMGRTAVEVVSRRADAAVAAALRARFGGVRADSGGDRPPGS